MSETTYCDANCNCGDDPDNLWPEMYISFDDFSSVNLVACKMCAEEFYPRSDADEFCDICEPYCSEYDLTTTHRQFDLHDWIEVDEYLYCASCGTHTNKCDCFEAPEESVASGVAWLEKVTERSPQKVTQLSAYISRRYRAS